MSGQWTRIAGEFNKNSSAADARGRRLTERRGEEGMGGFLTFPPAVTRGDFPHNQAALMLLTFVPGFVSPLAHFCLPNKRTQPMGKK